MDAADIAALRGRIEDQLRPPAAELVAAYFDPAAPFAGQTFDTLGRNDPYSVTADDLLACTLLNVSYPALAVRRILGDDQEHLAKLLAAVPADVDLWMAGDHDLAAAELAWEFLRHSYRGVDVVMAGKLLARKRPRLVPIVDKMISAALQFPPGRFWVTLAACLKDDSLRGAIDALRPPDNAAPVSTLRLLDVAVWMRGSDGTDARNVRTRLGMDVAPRP